MNKPLLFLVLLGPSIVVADCAPLAAHTATFNMMSGTKRHAISTTTLSQPDAQTWRYDTESEAKSLTAKLAGAKAFEETLFLRDGSTMIPQRYSYNRSTRFKKRRDVIEFDWENHIARNNNKDKLWELEIPDGALDEYIVNLALARALCANEAQLVFQVVDRKGRMEEQRYERLGEETVETPFGVFETVKVERLRDTDKRQTFTWHAPELDYLPIKIQHLEKGHDITAILTNWEPGT